MPDVKRSLSALQALLADNTSGDISAQDVRDMLVSVYPIVLPQPQGRLTTESGVAVSTSDRTSQSTIYYTPYTGNGLWLYDGTIWHPYTFTERSLALSGLTSGKNYDVFIYDNAGTVTLELSAAWTTDTARADALTTQDGVYVKSGATTRRWLGTIRTTSTTATEDSLTKRFVWNYYNAVARPMLRLESTSSWTLNSTTWRPANNSTANRLELVSGLAGGFQLFQIVNYANITSTGDNGRIAIAIDSTTTPAANNLGILMPNTVNALATICSLNDPQLLGYHYYQWIEKTGGFGAGMTFYGTAGGILQSGISGDVAC